MKKKLIPFLCLAIISISFAKTIKKHNYQLKQKNITAVKKGEYINKTPLIKIKKTTHKSFHKVKEKKHLNIVAPKIKEPKFKLNAIHKQRKLKIYPKQRVIMNSENEIYRNTFLFGAGGFKNIDSIKYIIDYYKEFLDKDFSIYFHIGHDASGEPYKNEDSDINNYYLKTHYKKFDVELSQTINKNSIPTSKNYNNSQQFDDTKQTITNFNLGYKISPKNTNGLKVGLNLYHNNVKSNNYDWRNFNNFYINGYLQKDYNFSTDTFTDLNNYSNLKSNIYSENVLNEQTTVLNTLFNDRIQILNDDSLQIKLHTGLEIANHYGKGEINGKIHVSATKKMAKYYGIMGDIFLSNFNKPYKTWLDNNFFKQFTLSPDIVPTTKLKREKNEKVGIGAYFNDDKLYSELKLDYTISQDKVFYNTSYLKDGFLPLYVTNYDNGDLKWFDLNLKSNYKLLKDLRIYGLYKYSTLSKISYTPEHHLKLGAIYSYKKYKLDLSANYYEGMYASFDKQSKLKPMTFINWCNKYKLNNEVSFDFNVYNLFDNSVDYKYGYPINGRKFTLDVQVLY